MAAQNGSEKAEDKAAETKKPVAKKKTRAKKATRRKATGKKAEPKSKGTCFVMMPFEEPFFEYYDDVYSPAIEAAGFTATKADEEFRCIGIVEGMWQMIQDAEVLLADMTEQNTNVFYELGLAHAIRKPVVLLAKTLDDVPFDLRHNRVILYDTVRTRWVSKLKKDITAAIEATAADPREAVPMPFRKLVESDAPEQDELSARVEAIEKLLQTVASGVPSIPRQRRSSFDEGDVLSHREVTAKLRSNPSVSNCTVILGRAFRSGMSRETGMRLIQEANLSRSARVNALTALNTAYLLA